MLLITNKAGGNKGIQGRHLLKRIFASQYAKQLIQILFQIDKVALRKSDMDMAVDGNALNTFLSCVTNFVSK